MAYPGADLSLNSLLNQIQTADLIEVERKELEKELWDRIKANEGTPLLQIQENGQYQITFLYSSKDAKTVKLECFDLYDRMLDEETGQPRQFEKIPGTDTFILTFNDVPPDAFATYNLIIDEKIDSPFVDSSNKNLLNRYKFDGERTYIQTTSSIHLPQTKLPEWATMKPPSVAKSEVKKEEFFKDETYPASERTIWIYKPEEFDELEPANRKVIFMLDGEHFCKTLTPYIDAFNESKDNPFSNTAIVYVNPGMAGRVSEYFFARENFEKFFAEKIMKKYCDDLGISKPDNVILAAHSLAAYPMIDVANKYTEKVGGVILLSPALNLELEAKLLPNVPEPGLSKLPIFMQIGQLEDAKPPKPHQTPGSGDYRGMKNISRLESNKAFHNELDNRYNIQSPIKIHPSGHSEIHVVDGMAEGLQFIHANHLKAKAEVSQESSTTKIVSALAYHPSPEKVVKSVPIDTQEKITKQTLGYMPKDKESDEAREEDSKDRRFSP